MSPNVYLCIVSSIRIAYCFVRIAIRIVSGFFRVDPALFITTVTTVYYDRYGLVRSTTIKPHYGLIWLMRPGLIDRG